MPRAALLQPCIRLAVSWTAIYRSACCSTYCVSLSDVIPHLHLTLPRFAVLVQSDLHRLATKESSTMMISVSGCSIAQQRHALCAGECLPAALLLLLHALQVHWLHPHAPCCLHRIHQNPQALSRCSTVFASALHTKQVQRMHAALAPHTHPTALFFNNQSHLHSEPLFCRQDAHTSSAAASKAAALPSCSSMDAPDPRQR